jgi:hypothetical protein
VKHRRSHRQTETGYARHRCPTAFEDKMIGQEVNSPAQKLLRSARRKRGALQGVNVLVNCFHVVPAKRAKAHWRHYLKEVPILARREPARRGRVRA